MGISPSAGAEGSRAGPLADLSESLVEAELISSNGWLIRLRWFAGLAALTGALLVGTVLPIGIPAIPIAVIGVFILLYNLVFLLINRRLIRSRRLSRSDVPPIAYRRLKLAQITMDWLVTMLLVHYTGGVESPVIFFFVFHICIAAMLFPRRTSFAFAILAIGLFAAVVAAEYWDLLPHYHIFGLADYSKFKNPIYIWAMLLSFSISLLIVNFLVSSISERLHSRQAEVVTLNATLQRSSARLQALNETAQVINSTLELTEVLNRLVENTARVMGVRACSIRLLDNTSKLLKPVAAYGLSQAYLDKGPLQLDHDPLDRVVLEGKVVNIPDVPQSDLLQYPDQAVQEGFFSMVSAPLLGKSGPLGILRAYSDERNRFSIEDESFLSAIAAQGSIAIENAMAYETIETLDDTRAAFVRVFTHELRSPVNVIRSLLQTILSGYVSEVNPQQREIIERAIRRVDFLRKLIDDLLDLAHGRMPLQAGESLAPVALDEILERVVKRFEVPAHEKSLTLTWQSPTEPGVTQVRADSEGLDRVFNNLIANAVKYTLPGGKVSVVLTRKGEEARVSVQDTGIGIPAEALPHLFEEFYRAPNARSLEPEGTGLGLSIVRETVKRCGGEVGVQSQPGEGTCFTVTLPLENQPH
jgi:signal transduction histidine kinase